LSSSETFPNTIPVILRQTLINNEIDDYYAAKILKVTAKVDFSKLCEFIKVIKNIEYPQHTDEIKILIDLDTELKKVQLKSFKNIVV